MLSAIGNMKASMLYPEFATCGQEKDGAWVAPFFQNRDRTLEYKGLCILRKRTYDYVPT